MSRKEYKKVYHGVPKSITDNHTIFYASLDGTKYSSDGCDLELGTGAFSKMPTGYGYKFNGDSKARVNNSYIKSTEGTIELFVNFDDYIKNTAGNTFVSLEDESGYRVLEVRIADSGKDMMFRMFKDNFDRPSREVIYRPNGWSGIHHVRATWSLNNSIKLFIDGVLVGKSTSNYTTDICINTPKTIVIGNGRYTSPTGTGVYGHIGTLSDVHISNIDRGDYFPNLPQDFIEGKAVIKPRMGQQQIKGDPIYSQVTELKVPAFGINGDGYNLNTTTSDGYTQVKNNPECYSKGSYEWKVEYGSAIRIKGLNGEVISGVIDTDTALGRVLSVTKLASNTAKVICDDVSKLSNNDKLNFCNPNNIGVNSWADAGIYGVVSELDSVDKSCIISCPTHSTTPSIGDIFLEITETSSSPIVKTQDGTDVVGTWSGLGTNEATFTLGENTDISGKDLYVKYSLNIAHGNSDFSELPKSIESINNENSVKLVETDSLTIEDDFIGKSKTIGDTCKFSAYYLTGSELVPISSLNSTNELSISNYYQISNNNPINVISYSTTAVDTRLQVVCKFNIVEMIERKFGREIPAIDKIKWVKDNLKSISYYVIASGNGSQSVRIVQYYSKENRWYKDPTIYNGTNYSILTYTNGNESPYYYANNSIDTDGNTYLVIYTDTISAIGSTVVLNLAYIKMSVELKYDTTFKLYFSENRRSREDICIPMLVQNETKTIKSYLDIKEPLVTEYSYNEFKGVAPSPIPDFKDFVYSNLLQLNSLGTGSYIGAKSMKYKASLANITERPTHYYTNEPIVNNVNKLYTTEDLINYRSGIRYLSRGVTYNNDGYARLILDSDDDANNFINILPSIININGELRLLILTTHFINKMADVNETYHFPIPNSPLLK